MFVGRVVRVMVTGTGTEVGLPAGTRVQMKSRAGQKGTVMVYEPGYSRGLFPVRLDDGIWQKCHASDVIVLGPAEGSRLVSAAPRTRRKVTTRKVTTLSDQEGGDGDAGADVGCADRATAGTHDVATCHKWWADSAGSVGQDSLPVHGRPRPSICSGMQRRRKRTRLGP